MISQDPSESYKLEQAKTKLPRGGETSIVYGVPSKIHDPSTCLIIAHGAGGPMHTPFIRYFHAELAKRGYLTVRFNFPYMEARRRVPDRREILEESYRTIVDQARNGRQNLSRVVIGGKSMGGRIASQIAANGVDVNGLFFLGYPLHPIGKTDQLRDEHLYRIKKPMLFVSGTRDSFARRDLLETVVAKIGRNATIHWIQGGDHSFKTLDAKTGSTDTLQEALSSLVNWLQTTV
jgi:predicted alpha/beta-hydrolase family hydrolase